MYSTVEQTGLQQYSGLSGGFPHIYEKCQNVLRYRGAQDRGLTMSLYSHLYNMVETLCHGLRAGRKGPNAGSYAEVKLKVKKQLYCWTLGKLK